MILTNAPSDLVTRLTAILGRDRLITSPGELLVYECDGFTIEKNRPNVVAFPTSTEEVARIVRVCNECDVPFLPRGAGTMFMMLAMSRTVGRIDHRILLLTGIGLNAVAVIGANKRGSDEVIPCTPRSRRRAMPARSLTVQAYSRPSRALTSCTRLGSTRRWVSR